MVDALRRAHRMLKPDGCVVDLHPSAARALVEAGGQPAGYVDAGDAPLRHAAAGVALATAIQERLLVVDREIVFDFYTYGDSIEELRDYVVENWREGQIDDETVERTRQLVRDAPPGTRPRLRERVHLTTLRPHRDPADS
jgi:hypothetical protein